MESCGSFESPHHNVIAVMILNLEHRQAITINGTCLCSVVHSWNVELADDQIDAEILPIHLVDKYPKNTIRDIGQIFKPFSETYKICRPIACTYLKDPLDSLVQTNPHCFRHSSIRGLFQNGQGRLESVGAAVATKRPDDQSVQKTLEY